MPQGVAHTGVVQSWPPQPEGHEQVSSATHRPPFSHIWAQAAVMARIMLLPVSAMYKNSVSERLAW